MTKFLLILTCISFFSCNYFFKENYISHPVTISFADFYKTSLDESKEVFDIKKNDLVFQGLSISAKAVSEKIEKIKNEKSDTSYFVMKGALVIGENNKGLILVRENEAFIVPRNIEHNLIPYENKQVKLIIHSSN